MIPVSSIALAAIAEFPIFGGQSFKRSRRHSEERRWDSGAPTLARAMPSVHAMVLLRLPIAAGERITANSPFLRLGDSTDIWFRSVYSAKPPPLRRRRFAKNLTQASASRRRFAWMLGGGIFFSKTLHAQH